MKQLAELASSRSGDVEEPIFTIRGDAARNPAIWVLTSLGAWLRRTVAVLVRGRRCWPSDGSIVDGCRIGADAQARRLLDLIELDLVRPPRNQTELRTRTRELSSITTLYHDPVLQFDAFRSRVPSW